MSIAEESWNWRQPVWRSAAACLALNLFAGSGATGQAAQGTVGQSYTNGLTLHEVVQRALTYNESLQIKMLDAEISRRQFKAETGIFEPAVVASYQRVDSRRENTAEQQSALTFGFGGTLTTFNERNNLYDGGLEFLSPVGTKFRIGYSERELLNNLQIRKGLAGEWASTVGATLTQPLLKNFGLAATLARIRLAAVASDMAFQDYRRQLMLIVSRAEAAYWDLYLTQEQERISVESVGLAETVFKDNRARVEVGKSSELEVLQAEAGLSLRKSRQSDARQKLSEAANQLATLISGSAADTNLLIRAKDQPVAKEVPLNYFDSYSVAFELNPDYLTRRTQIAAENIKVAYAKNQKLPQLDLKASYGLNGLGNSFLAGFDGTEFPAWSVGVEMRVPITGGIKERNELEAAKLSQKRALVGLKEVEVQIGNALDTSILKVRNLGESVKNYQLVVDFHQQLLEAQLVRLEVGKTDSKTVLETEEKLFEAKISTLDSLVQYQKALLELELVQGSTLRARNMDLTKPELQSKTSALLAGGTFSGPEFESLRMEVQSEYESTTQLGLDPVERAREKLRQSQQGPEAGTHETARRLLRQKIDEMERSKYSPPAQPPK
ncbi:MAG: TolC family protein [Chloroflexi bacterium]|nr:TolC family protein [Chloroflexota bacterium]